MKAPSPTYQALKQSKPELVPWPRERPEKELIGLSTS